MLEIMARFKEQSGLHQTLKGAFPIFVLPVQEWVTYKNATDFNENGSTQIHLTNLPYMHSALPENEAGIHSRK